MKELYHTWYSIAGTTNPSITIGSTCKETADLIIAFNAGIWGYESWKPTLEYIIDISNSKPFVFTSYNKLEAEDSVDILSDIINDREASEEVKVKFIWSEEDSPFPSKLQDRNPTTGAMLCDNLVWTCIVSEPWSA